MGRKVLRLLSGAMLTIAILFLAFALTHPEFGTVFYIGNFAVGSDIWRIFYMVYAFVTIGLFLASFFVPKRK